MKTAIGAGPISAVLTCAVAAAVLACGARAAGAEQESGPWPAEVKGHVPVAPGEHPRLLFRKSDLPELRRRARTPEGKAILKRLRVLLNGGDGESMPTRYNPVRRRPSRDGSGPTADAPAGMYTISHTAGFGLLYLVTGEKKYADLGRQCMEKALDNYRDRDNRYSFRDPYGALRAGPSLGWTAVGYDLCYNGWDADFRRKVALAIQNYNEGSGATLPALVRGSRHMPASNHWGMQVGGGALALLAILGDPGVSSDRLRPLLAVSQKAMIRNLTEGFGDHGWFAEGDGTGVMSSHIVFLAALQAWRVAAGRDFCTPRPNARWTVLKFVLQTIPRRGRPDFPRRGAYPHNVWSRSGMSGAGTFCQGFGIVNDDEKPALLWLYNRVSRELDEKAGGPFETASEYPHRAILSLVNWPFGMEERNPEYSIPRAVHDGKFGFCAFRNRWKDENDTLVTVQALSTRGWHRARTAARVWIWALGRKTTWGRLAGKVTYFKGAEDGSGLVKVADGTCLAVDFSKASGAEAMLVLTGPGAPREGAVTAGGRHFAFHFVTPGGAPTPKVEGDSIVVGSQTVSWDGERIALGCFGKGLKVPAAPIARAGGPLTIGGIRYVPQDASAAITATLSYRPQGRGTYTAVPLQKTGETYQGVIPAAATRGPVEYFITFREAGGRATTYPPGGSDAPAVTVPDGLPPTLPGDLDVVLAKSYAVDLRWQAARDDTKVTGYRVHRAAANENPITDGKLLAEVAAETLTFRDGNPPAGSSARYAVQAIDAVGRLGRPRSIVVRVPPDGPPANELALTAAGGSKAVVLRWSGTAEPDVTAVLVLRADGEKGEFRQVAEVNDLSTGRWADTSLTPGATYRYRIRLRDAAGHVSEASKAVSARPVKFIKRINCGGKEVVAADGAAWEADRGSVFGTGYFTTKAKIAGAGEDLQPVYQSERWASRGLRYRLDVDAPGRYVVRLLFAETNDQFSAKGRRTFDVIINGRKRHEKVDVFARAGANTAWHLDTPVEVGDDRQVEIVLRKVSGGPAIKGIELRAAD
jgi:hypothetical protein